MITASPPTRHTTLANLLRTATRNGQDTAALHHLRAGYCIQQIARTAELSGRRIVMVGDDTWCAEAFHDAGARCLVVDPSPQPLSDHTTAVAGDGYWLPLKDAATHLTYCSGQMEDRTDFIGLLDELVRITAVNGLIYLSFTNPPYARRLRRAARSGRLLHHIRRRGDVDVASRTLRYLPRPFNAWLSPLAPPGTTTQLILRRTR